MGPEHPGVGPLPPAYAKEWEASGRSFPVLSAESWKIVMDAYADARALVPRDQLAGRTLRGPLGRPAPSVQGDAGVYRSGARRHVRRRAARTSFSADRRDAFRRDLDEATITKLEASLADHLRLWGYDL